MGAGRDEDRQRDAEASTALPERRGSRFSPGANAPTSIGRFEIVRRIAGGGMGVVYEARDPELARHVAIKVVRPDRADVDGDARMRREAQALARLAHPNIVPIFEVGQWGLGLYIVMELIEGVTLRDWMAERERSWPDLLAMMIPIGRGLEAAHAAGVVHRDFKPDNVLIGADGRARIVDFGLARPVQSADESAAEESSLESTIDGGGLHLALTQTGAVVGTPAYMAPEQHLAEPADERSDQFAFCVTLWEALFGARPFAGNSQKELVQTTVRGTIQPPPDDRGVPEWLRTAITRGLSSAPEDRFESIGALLAAIDHSPGRRRARLVAAIGVPLLALAAGLGGYRWAAGGSAATGANACVASADRLRGIWDDQTRAAIGARFAEYDEPFVRETWTATDAEIGAFAADWARIYDGACAARDEEPLLHAQRMACLEDRLLELEAVSQFLGEYDARAFSVGSVGGLLLSQPDLCENEKFLRAQQSPPPKEIDEQLRAAELRFHKGRAIARAQLNAMGTTGREGLEVMRDALHDLEALGYAPAIADAMATFGEYNVKLTGRDDALRRALEFAEKNRADRSVAEIAGTILASNYPRTPAGDCDVSAGAALLDKAELALVRVGSPRWAARSVLQAKVSHWLCAGRPEQALATLGTASEDLRRVGHPLHGMRAVVYDKLGREDEAADEQRLRVEFDEKRLGPDRPMLVPALIDWSNALVSAGKLDQALVEAKRAVSIAEATTGPRSRPTGVALLSLGRAQLWLAEVDLSIATLEEALAIIQTTDAGDSKFLTQARQTLISAYLMPGRYRALLPRVQKMLESSTAPDERQMLEAIRGFAQFALGDHRALAAYARDAVGIAPTLPPAQTVVALAEARAGKRKAALARADAMGKEQAGEKALVYHFAGALERSAASARVALPMFEKLGDSNDVAAMGTWIGVDELAKKDYRAAASDFERALTIGKRYPEEVYIPAAELGLAQALWASGGDHSRAVALAQSALSWYEQRADGWAPERNAARSWLARHSR